MTFRIKAIAAALIVSFTPAIAVAQDGEQAGGGHAPAAYDCGAANAQNQIGRNINGLIVPSHIRVIGPDTLVTLDYLPHRMNVRHNAAGIITAVYCG